MAGERFAAGRRAVSAFLHDDSLRRSLPRNVDGEAHILVALPKDSIGKVLRDLTRIGMPLTLVVDDPSDNGVRSVRVTPSGDSVHIHDEDVFQVHPNITVRMLLDAVWDQGGSLTMHVSEPEAVREADFEVMMGS